VNKQNLPAKVISTNQAWQRVHKTLKAGYLTGQRLVRLQEYLMTGEMVHVGFGNILAMNRVIAISAPNSAPTKRTIQEARSKGILIDMTNGRRTKAVVFLDSGHVVLAALAPETITGRLNGGRAIKPELEDEPA